MFVSDCLQVNGQGHLTIGGVDSVALAQQYGTPLYVMDEGQIRENCRKYRQSFEKYYQGHGIAAHASKAFCCKAICNIMKEEQMGLDVVSGGELYTAMSVGFPADRIYFHGNNKTPQELLEALDYGVGHIVVDNLAELELLNQLACSQKKQASIQLRIKPGVDAHTHSFIRTGQIDSKFGFALETGEALAAVKEALALPNIELKGLHCHIGSQIFEIAPFEHTARIMLDFLAEIRTQTGAELKELNLGGGFGIQYLPSEHPAGYDSYMEKVSQVVKESCAENNFPMPFITLEPGRSIVGSAGITLYTVGAVKVIPNIRTYVSVDGGMGDNPRYALYQSRYHALVANKAAEPASMQVTIAGKCCESGDLIGEGIPVQPVQTGDILAVLSTGAYNYSMASNYNRIPRPAVVMVKDGASRIVVQRETFEQITQNDLL